MRIKKIAVTRLFGIFNHTIPMNLDSHITIIHGPNGFGKTILLRMLNDFFNMNYQIFYSIPFEDFTITLDNGETIRVERHFSSARQKSLFDDTDTHETNIQAIIISSSEKKPYIPSRLSGRRLALLSRNIERTIPNLIRVDKRRWRNSVTGADLSIEEIIYQYKDQLQSYSNFSPDDENKIEDDSPIWLKDLISGVKIKFVEANRLYKYSTMDVQGRFGGFRDVTTQVAAVKSYAVEISQIIQETLADYAEISQSKDRSFPIRLMKQEENIDADPAILTAKLDDLEKKRAKLMELGLLDREEDIGHMPSLEEEEALSSVLSVYVKDMEEKLAVFDDLAARLRIFEDIVNARFQFKTMSINKRNGIIFTTPNGNTIALDNLSSGEQHELVLLYQLLFQVDENSLILIDEPELSLHVAWQRRFLDDLERITNLRKFDVLIATHSPSIIGDKQDWMVALERPEDMPTDATV